MGKVVNISTERKRLIDSGLSNLFTIFEKARSESYGTLAILDAYYDSLEDDDFPHKQNVYRFIQRYRSVFTERTHAISYEVDALRKDWQLKSGTFNKEKGVWEYE